jgi:hypothetical protein
MQTIKLADGYTCSFNDKPGRKEFTFKKDNEEVFKHTSENYMEAYRHFYKWKTNTYFTY